MERALGSKASQSVEQSKKIEATEGSESKGHSVHEELGGYEGAKLAMWLFLATELLLFGVLFAAFALFHIKFLEAFKLAHHSLDKVMGGTNTLVLILSSMSAALSFRCHSAGTP